MGLGHLTYSTLVHPTDNWDQLWKSVNTYLPQVKARVAPHEKFGVCLRTSAPSAELLVDRTRQARRPEAVLRRQRPLSLHRQRVRLRRVQEAGHQGGRLRAGLGDAGAPRVHEAGRRPPRRAGARRHQPVDPERAARLQAEGHRRRRRRGLHRQRHRRRRAPRRAEEEDRQDGDARPRAGAALLSRDDRRDDHLLQEPPLLGRDGAAAGEDRPA